MSKHRLKKQNQNDVAAPTQSLPGKAENDSVSVTTTESENGDQQLKTEIQSEVAVPTQSSSENTENDSVSVTKTESTTGARKRRVKKKSENETKTQHDSDAQPTPIKDLENVAEVLECLAAGRPIDFGAVIESIAAQTPDDETGVEEYRQETHGHLIGGAMTRRAVLVRLDESLKEKMVNQRQMNARLCVNAEVERQTRASVVCDSSYSDSEFADSSGVVSPQVSKSEDLSSSSSDCECSTHSSVTDVFCNPAEQALVPKVAEKPVSEVRAKDPQVIDKFAILNYIAFGHLPAKGEHPVSVLLKLAGIAHEPARVRKLMKRFEIVFTYAVRIFIVGCLGSAVLNFVRIVRMHNKPLAVLPAARKLNYWGIDPAGSLSTAITWLAVAVASVRTWVTKFVPLSWRPPRKWQLMCAGDEVAPLFVSRGDEPDQFRRMRFLQGHPLFVDGADPTILEGTDFLASDLTNWVFHLARNREESNMWLMSMGREPNAECGSIDDPRVQCVFDTPKGKFVALSEERNAESLAYYFDMRTSKVPHDVAKLQWDTGVTSPLYEELYKRTSPEAAFARIAIDEPHHIDAHKALAGMEISDAVRIHKLVNNILPCIARPEYAEQHPFHTAIARQMLIKLDFSCVVGEDAVDDMELLGAISLAIVKNSINELSPQSGGTIAIGGYGSENPLWFQWIASQRDGLVNYLATKSPESLYLVGLLLDSRMAPGNNLAIHNQSGKLSDAADFVKYSEMRELESLHNPPFFLLAKTADTVLDRLLTLAVFQPLSMLLEMTAQVMLNFVNDMLIGGYLLDMCIGLNEATRSWLAHMCDKHGVCRPRVCFAGYFATIGTAGDWWLFLPSDVGRFPDKELQAIIAHELGHIVHNTSSYSLWNKLNPVLAQVHEVWSDMFAAKETCPCQVLRGFVQVHAGLNHFTTEKLETIAWEQAQKETPILIRAAFVAIVPHEVNSRRMRRLLQYLWVHGHNEECTTKDAFFGPLLPERDISGVSTYIDELNITAIAKL